MDKAYMKHNTPDLTIIWDEKRTMERIAECIESIGKSNYELADWFTGDKSKEVMSEQAVDNWRKMKNCMRIQNIKYLALYIGVDIDDIIVFVGDKPKKLVSKYKRVESSVRDDSQYNISRKKIEIKIRRLMWQKGYSDVKELAQIMGVSPTTIRNWMKGSIPRWDRLKKLSIVLGVKMNDIIKIEADTIERTMNVF